MDFVKLLPLLLFIDCINNFYQGSYEIAIFEIILIFCILLTFRLGDIIDK